MKRLIILTIAISTLLSVPAYAYPTYSEETARLMKEAGLNTEYDVDAIMERQDALKSGKATNSTPSTQNGQEKANKTLKSHNDEYRIFANGTDEAVKVTDTSDELHIYSDTYSNPSGYSKYSNDEFSIGGKDTPANDRYSEDSFDQLHIDKMYQDKLWYPSNKVQKMGIDEIRLPNQPTGW